MEAPDWLGSFIRGSCYRPHFGATRRRNSTPLGYYGRSRCQAALPPAARLTVGAFGFLTSRQCRDQRASNDAQTRRTAPALLRASGGPLFQLWFDASLTANEPERTKMHGRLAREWPPIPPRRGIQSIGGGRTGSQQCQVQEPSLPQHSQTNKLYCQSPSCVRAPAVAIDHPGCAWLTAHGTRLCAHAPNPAMHRTSAANRAIFNTASVILSLH